MNTLQARAVLMKFGSGMPGQHRADKVLSRKVQASEGLGENSGKWVKELWPPDSLAAIKKVENEARSYHDRVTLPFGSRSDNERQEKEANRERKQAIAGIGILSASLILEYGDTMRNYVGKLEKAVNDWLVDPQKYIDWARANHNGTFDFTDYEGFDESGNFDPDAFRQAMRKKFYIRTEPLPVPDASQFTQAITELLGVDAESVNLRVADASQEAQRELMRRLIEPVRAMAAKLVEQPKPGKEDIIFRDTLVDNIKEIARLAPKMNLAGDPEIDRFAQECEGLTHYTAQTLRDDKLTREEAAKKAAEIAAKMSAYKL